MSKHEVCKLLCGAFEWDKTWLSGDSYRCYKNKQISISIDTKRAEPVHEAYKWQDDKNLALANMIINLVHNKGWKCNVHITNSTMVFTLIRSPVKITKGRSEPALTVRAKERNKKHYRVIGSYMSLDSCTSHANRAYRRIVYGEKPLPLEFTENSYARKYRGNDLIGLFRTDKIYYIRNIRIVSMDSAGSIYSDIHMPNAETFFEVKCDYLATNGMPNEPNNYKFKSMTIAFDGHGYYVVKHDNICFPHIDHRLTLTDKQMLNEYARIHLARTTHGT